MEHPITITLVCHTFPTAFPPGSAAPRLGLQEKKEVVHAVPYSGEEEILFAVDLQAALDPASGSARFKGKAVQGPSSERFLYLSWGDWSNGAWVMVARTKIQLSMLPGELLKTALASGRGVRARLCLSDARGRPATGSLKAAQVVWSLAE